MGRHVSVYQHDPAVASWGTKRFGVLCVPGKGCGGGPESEPLYIYGRWPCLRKARGEPQPEREAVQEAVRAADVLRQLHEQRPGVHVVQQHAALRGLQRLHHLLPLRAVPRVADGRLRPSELFRVENLWTVSGTAWVWLVQRP